MWINRTKIDNPTLSSVAPPLAPYLGQVLVFLGLVAVAHELVDAQVGVGPVTEPHSRRGTGDLLHHQHMVQVSQGRSTVFRWEERKKLMLPTTHTRSWGWAQYLMRSKTLRMVLGLTVASLELGTSGFPHPL